MTRRLGSSSDVTGPGATVVGPAVSTARIASVGLLGLLAGGLVQFSLSVASPVLVVDLGITEPQVGLATSVLMGSAAALVCFVGPVADRIGARRALGVLFLASIVSLLVLVLAQSLAWVLVAAAIGGLAIACGNPVTNMVVATGKSLSGLVVGVKQSGVMVAQVLCGLSIPAISLFASWRWGVAVLVLMPLLGMALSAGLPADRPSRHPRRALPQLPAGEANGQKVAWLTGYSFLGGWATSTLTTYLPTFAVTQVGMSLTAAGAAVVGLGVAGCLARLVWATVAASMDRPRLLLAFLSTVGAGAIGAVGLARTGGPLLIWIGALAAGSCMAGFASVVQVVVLRVARAGEVGRVTSLVQLGFLSGLFVGPAAAGLLLASAGYDALWLTASVMAVGSAAITAAGPASLPKVEARAASR